jgi:hypothetical protein
MSRPDIDGGANQVRGARSSLEDARERLDAEVRTLAVGDDAMASPLLLGLLLHAVAARRHLDDLEFALSADLPKVDGNLSSRPPASAPSSTWRRETWP